MTPRRGRAARVRPEPASVRLRAYNVGFGDCLLLSVGYTGPLSDGRAERHMLIDCGSRQLDPNGPTLEQVAALVAEHTGGRLDVVVATHRHQDHISGFGQHGSATILDGLAPAVVIRPWTDVPDQAEARTPLHLDPTSESFLGTLEDLHRLASHVDSLAFDDSAVAARAKELAQLGLKNVQAIARLESWAAAGRGFYVRAGDDVDLREEMPAVRIQVLGPPTLAQVDRLTSYAKESEEYWFALSADSARLPALVGSGSLRRVRSAATTLAPPGGVGAAEWLVRTVNSAPIAQGLEIVEGFDDVLNNTSVILLVSIGDRTLLLPGDAQAENWSHTLDLARGENGSPGQAALRRLLTDVDVYKVGHHGSRNATPRRLESLWAAPTTRSRPLVSVLTTRQGVFEKSIEGTVPKADLVKALAQLGPVHSTDALPADVWWFDVQAPATGDSGFEFSPGAAMPSH